MRIDVSLVDALIRGQFPRRHGLELTELEEARDQAERDFEVVSILAPHLPVAVPEPLELGEAAEKYP